MNKSSSPPGSEDAAADVAMLLQQTRSALEQLQSEVSELRVRVGFYDPTGFSFLSFFFEEKLKIEVLLL